MEKVSKIYVGLEIGTHKICFAAGEVKPGHAIKILGFSVSDSLGVKEGEIYDVSLARQCLTKALAEAENVCDIEIGSVILAVTGDHIKGSGSCGTYCLPDADSEVTLEHIEEACSIAREIRIPDKHVYIHPIVTGYRLDDADYPKAPVGLCGKTLEANFHVIHGDGDRLQSSIRMVRSIGLEIDDLVFSPISIAQVSLLVDIGGGTTDYALYLNGSIAASGSIPIGGDHVTQDIRLATGLSFLKAECLKISEGNASEDPFDLLGTAELEDEDGRKVEVLREVLNKAIHNRLKEVLSLVRDQMPAGALASIRAGVFVTGGTTQTRGFNELASKILGCEIHDVDRPKFSGILTGYDSRYLSTAAGLLRYAQISDTE
jgi:cell division protein FtsA